MASSVNEALVRRAIETIWNQGDLDVADELFAPEYVNHHGVISDLVMGPEAIKISAALHRLALPNLCVVVEELSGHDEMVVVRWTVSREPIGHPNRRNVGSSQYSLKGITRSRIAGGKIVESWTDWDQIGALRDMGVGPSK
jgi:hypothetical protein